MIQKIMPLFAFLLFPFATCNSSIEVQNVKYKLGKVEKTIEEYQRER